MNKLVAGVRETKGVMIAAALKDIKSEADDDTIEVIDEAIDYIVEAAAFYKGIKLKEAKA